jgi:hypothetical protein
VLRMQLPDGRPPRPGATAHDWFKVLVAQEPISSRVFHLDALHTPGAGTRTRLRDPAALRGGLARLGMVARRDIVPEPDLAADWATSTVAVITTVPCGAGA